MSVDSEGRSEPGASDEGKGAARRPWDRQVPGDDFDLEAAIRWEKLTADELPEDVYAWFRGEPGTPQYNVTRLVRQEMESLGFVWNAAAKCIERREGR